MYTRSKRKADEGENKPVHLFKNESEAAQQLKVSQHGADHPSLSKGVTHELSKLDGTGTIHPLSSSNVGRELNVSSESSRTHPSSSTQANTELNDSERKVRTFPKEFVQRVEPNLIETLETLRRENHPSPLTKSVRELNKSRSRNGFPIEAMAHSIGPTGPLDTPAGDAEEDQQEVQRPKKRARSFLGSRRGITDRGKQRQGPTFESPILGDTHDPLNLVSGFYSLTIFDASYVPQGTHYIFDFKVAKGLTEYNDASTAVVWGNFRINSVGAIFKGWKVYCERDRVDFLIEWRQLANDTNQLSKYVMKAPMRSGEFSVNSSGELKGNIRPSKGVKWEFTAEKNRGSELDLKASVMLWESCV